MESITEPTLYQGLSSLPPMDQPGNHAYNALMHQAKPLRSEATTQATDQPLAGWQVLLVQSEREAAPRLAELRSLGAVGLNLPVIKTRWLDKTPARLLALYQAQSASDLVFASPKAVAGCFRLLPDFRPQGLVHAQGPATQAALAARGIVSSLPASGFTSEDLLAQPHWANPHGRRVVRIEGQGGRALLLESLAARGASTQGIAVYRRVTQPLSLSRLAALDALHRPLLVISSAESVQALQTRLPAVNWQRLRRAPWLVSSKRLAQLAAESGSREVVLARSATWADLRAALRSFAADGRARC